MRVVTSPAGQGSILCRAPQMQRCSPCAGVCDEQRGCTHHGPSLVPAAAKPTRRLCCAAPTSHRWLDTHGAALPTLPRSAADIPSLPREQVLDRCVVSRVWSRGRLCCSQSLACHLTLDVCRAQVDAAHAALPPLLGGFERCHVCCWPDGGRGCRGCRQHRLGVGRRQRKAADPLLRRSGCGGGGGCVCSGRALEVPAAVHLHRLGARRALVSAEWWWCCASGGSAGLCITPATCKLVVSGG